MNYLEFQKQIEENVLDYLPDKYADALVQMQQVRKNNGVMLDGISILRPGDNAAPTIYLNDYYRHYQYGRELDDILQEIAKITMESQRNGRIDVNKLLDFEEVKDKIIFKVIGVQNNEVQLQSMPHRVEQDLAQVYQILVEKREDGNALLTITNEVQERLGVSEEILHEAAMINTPREFLPTFRSIKEVIKEMMKEDFMSEMMGNTENKEMREFLEEMFSEQFDEMEEPDVPMYVLSNDHLSNGAAVIFYPEMKEYIAEQLQGDFFVLPSSVHETLIVPDNGNMDYQELKSMVNEVNRTEVSELDVLAGEVYFFDREAREFMIAGDREQRKAEVKRDPSILEKLQQKVEQNISGTGGRKFGEPELVM